MWYIFFCAKKKKKMWYIKQEGQDGPGLLIWIFERTKVTSFFMESNFLYHFLKQTSKGTFQPSLVQIGPAV